MFDWLEDGLANMVIETYKEIGSGMTSVLAEAVKSPSVFNNTAWQSVTVFNKNVVLPIAWSILSLFLLMELAQLFRGLDSIYWVCIVILKIMLAKLLMENMTTIINAIFDISSSMVTSAQNQFIGSAKGFTISKEATDNLTNALSKYDTLGMLGIFVTSLLVKIVNAVCTVLARVIVDLRFIEIYVFTAIAALPFATLASNEYSTIGKNFIKRMIALAIHVIFIVIVFYMYVILTNGATISTTDATDMIFQALGYSLLCVIALFQTGSWSKQLMGI